MGLWSRLKRTIRGGEQHAAEVEEELQFHLDMDAASGGLSERGARLRLGNVTRIEEETRAMGIVEWLESALQDACYGLRQLRKSPALTLAVVLSLAIGVGANTAIFSLIDAAILKPLPVQDPDSLRMVEWTNEGFPPHATNVNGEVRDIAGGRRQGSSIAAFLYRRLAGEQTAFAPLMGIGAYPEPVAVAAGASPAEQVTLQYVSSNLFEGLGVRLAIGRAFRGDEDRVAAEPVVIVSHRFWINRLAGSSDVLERTLRVNNVAVRIVGVAPPGFFGLRAGDWPDLYAPLAAKVALLAAAADGNPRGEDDGNWWVRPIGRLKPGVSEEAARTQLSQLFANILAPEGGVNVPRLTTLPGRRGANALDPRDARALWILMLLVGVLLLIVCANVANLLLSRAVSRQRESAIRLALGAARTRLLRQHLIESGVFAVLGGAAGLALGYVLAQSIHWLFQTGRDASSAFDLHVDPRVLGYTAALSAVTALLFGLAPAVRAARSTVNDALKAQSRSVVTGRLRLPRLLVSMQIALCLTALVAAGLLGRTLENLKLTEIGFDRENLAYATVNPARAGYTGQRAAQYADRVREQILRVPGVSHVSPVHTRLLSGGGNGASVNIAGIPYDQQKGATINGVGEDFFATMGIELVSGRAPSRQDVHEGFEGVAVDELFARQFFPGQNPIGRRFGLGPKENNRYEIIGVVRGSRYNSLRGVAVPSFYRPYQQFGTIHLAIRAGIDSDRLAEAVRKTVASVDPAVPLTEFHTQTGLIDRLLRTERLLAFASGAFGAVALALAAIGLGGVLAYAVARRTNEIGIRVALGAASGDVVRMVLRDSLWMAGLGVAIGLPCAYGVARLLESSLFGLKPLDFRTAALSLAALAAIAVLAAWAPARRAARVDPMSALREE